MPNEFKYKYIDILFKHKDDISIGKHHLRQAKNFQHRIHLKENNPVYRKQFKIPDSHHDFLTKEITEWLNLGVVHHSSSMYNSPIFVFQRKMVLVYE